MNRIRSSHSLRRRLYFLAALGLTVLLLVGLASLVEKTPAVPDPGSGPKEEKRVAATGSIEQHIYAVCAEFGISQKFIRSRKVRNQAGRVLRMERRITVPRDFSSYEFNSALNRRVDLLGARVMGTEHSRNHTVTLQVIQGDSTLETVILEIRQQ